MTTDTNIPDTTPPVIDVTTEEAGQRIDRLLTARFPDRSRSFFQNLISSGGISLNNTPVTKAKTQAFTGHQISIDWPKKKSYEMLPEAMDLDILYEDPSMMVINKPAGLLIHPTENNHSHTLANGLLALRPECFSEGWDMPERAGIVHRLDKDTSGLLVVAKTLTAATAIRAMFKKRIVEKVYLALIWGSPPRTRGDIETLVGRHPRHRHKRTVLQDSGKEARTHYDLLQEGKGASLLKVILDTGRTHQIRVHMAHIHRPVVGDALYGGIRPTIINCPKRQMLHAWKLALPHPETGEPMVFQVPPPIDFTATTLVFGMRIPKDANHPHLIDGVLS